MSVSFEALPGRFVDLRPLATDDAAVTLAWRMGDRARLLNSGAGDVAQQAAWIAARPESERNYMIVLKDGTPVGMLSLIGINSTNRNAEPSRFLIGEEALVRGIPAAVEAMSLLYRLAFDDLNLARLYGTVASGNAKMLKWQKYLGMQEEGRMRRHLWLDGEWHDAIIVGLLESEYRTVTLPRMQLLLGMGS
jgi:diamine N-acetyltransferase